MITKSKDLVIIKAVSSAGKSTFAELIAGNMGIICCADDHFTDEQGNYNFDASKLHQAHKACQQKCQDSMKNEFSPIIISNTNTKERDWKSYVKMAEQNGYRVFHVVLERRHNNKNSHNVPMEVIERQKNALQNNIKLY